MPGVDGYKEKSAFKEPLQATRLCGLWLQTLSLPDQQPPLTCIIFLVFCAIKMLACFPNLILNKHSLCFPMSGVEPFWKAQFSFPWAFLASDVLTGVVLWGGWVEQICMLFPLAERILGHSQVKWIPQVLNGTVSELRRKPEGTRSSFFFFVLCLILVWWRQRESSFPPTEQVLPLLHSSCLSWLSIPLEFSRPEGLPT